MREAPCSAALRSIAADPACDLESRLKPASRPLQGRLYNDADGREHVQLQFQLRGPSGRATVNAGGCSSRGALVLLPMAPALLLAIIRKHPHACCTITYPTCSLVCTRHRSNPPLWAVRVADMHQDSGAWRYNFLYLDVEAPLPQQVSGAGGTVAA